MQPEREEHREVWRLFHKHVPEVADGVVEIKGIARERRQRAIVSVVSNDSAIDPFGACAGERGVRVKAMVAELSGEKIDLVRWSESTEDYVRELLAPAQLARVALDHSSHCVRIHAAPDQRSLIVGPRGIRLRLVEQITGWRLSVTDT